MVNPYWKNMFYLFEPPQAKHHQKNRWMNPSCSAKDVLGNLSAQIRNFGAVRFFDVGGIIDYG